MKILGIRNVDYVSKKTGNRVQGVELHVVEPFAKDKGLGEVVDKIWLPQEVWQRLNVVAAGDPANIIGKSAEFVYNKFGTVTDVRIMASK